MLLTYFCNTPADLIVCLFYLFMLTGYCSSSWDHRNDLDKSYHGTLSNSELTSSATRQQRGVDTDNNVQCVSRVVASDLKQRVEQTVDTTVVQREGLYKYQLITFHYAPVYCVCQQVIQTRQTTVCIIRNSVVACVLTNRWNCLGPCFYGVGSLNSVGHYLTQFFEWHCDFLTFVPFGYI